MNYLDFRTHGATVKIMEELFDNVQLQDREKDRCEAVNGSKRDSLRGLWLTEVIQQIV